MKKLGKKISAVTETLEAYGSCYCYGYCTSTSASKYDMQAINSMQTRALNSW